MAKTISATYTVVQTPNFATDNPLSIATTGTISLTGNRHAFEGGEAVQLHPAFGRDHALHLRLLARASMLHAA